MMETAQDISDGFRAWGATALFFALPALRAFFRVALKRAIRAAKRETAAMRIGPRRAFAFASGALQAGFETNLRVNAWVPVALLLFAGLAGGSIFLSSAIAGSYRTAGLTFVMLPLWAMLSAAAWGAAIETASSKRSYALSCGILFVTTQVIALILGDGL